MNKISIKELNKKLYDKQFMEDIKTISIIHNDTERLHFAVYFDDLTFMEGYECEVNVNLEDSTIEDWEELIQNLIKLSDKYLILHFQDKELSQAWKKSYLDGGITKDRWDRRTIFHPYNEPNELFCIDDITYHQIIDDDERLSSHIPKWKQGIITWYRDVAIKNIV